MVGNKRPLHLLEWQLEQWLFVVLTLALKSYRKGKHTKVLQPQGHLINHKKHTHTLFGREARGFPPTLKIHETKKAHV